MSGGNPLGSSNISVNSNTKQSGPNTSGGKNQAFVSLGIKQLTTSTPPQQQYWITKSNTYNSVSTTSITSTPSTLSVYMPKDLYVAGTIYGTVVAPSDITVKENIRDLSLEVDFNKLLELNPKQYTYTDDVEHKIHYGLIAQDVEKIYPELIYSIQSDTDESTSSNILKSVNYVEMIPLLLLKIQDLQKQVDELKK
jgi:hypothetical protein